MEGGALGPDRGCAANHRLARHSPAVVVVQSTPRVIEDIMRPSLQPQQERHVSSDEANKVDDAYCRAHVKGRIICPLDGGEDVEKNMNDRTSQIVAEKEERRNPNS